MIRFKTLSRSTWECVHFDLSDQFLEIQKKIELEGINVFNLDAATINNEQDFFKSIATIMSFPDYFGFNWDALDECLRDLNWVEAKGYILRVHNSQELWERCFGLCGNIVMTWQFCSEEWSKENVPFHLIFKK